MSLASRSAPADGLEGLVHPYACIHMDDLHHVSATSTVTIAVIAELRTRAGGLRLSSQASQHVLCIQQGSVTTGGFAEFCAFLLLFRCSAFANGLLRLF